jgi:uncharacterized membrane protein
MAGKRAANWMILGGICSATAAAYFLDRENGRDRRERFARKAKHLAKAMVDETALGVRDSQHRLFGTAREAWLAFRHEHLDDRVLVERIRSRMGRIVSHPHKIHVASDEGTVTLWGQLPPREAGTLIHTVTGMRGVKEIRDHIELREATVEPNTERDALRDAKEWTRLGWSPWQRLLARVAGTAIAVYGWRRRDNVGAALSFIGTGLAAQAWMKRNVQSVLALSDECPGFELERTVRINAPISDIYEFWCNPENYPKVFSHIASVERQGENLYRWTISGPAGIPIRWDGIITRTVPNTLVEWKSMPGSTVGNFGVARFDPNYDASTRVHIRMFYRPPAGILGRFLAELFGSDPKKVLDQDLARLKRIFETDEDLVKTLKEGGDEQLLKIATT